MIEICLKFNLPFQVAVFLVVPKLHGINDVLPQHVGTWRNDTNGIQEMKQQPNANDVVFLSKGLAALNARLVAPNARDAFAYAKENKADYERKENQKK